MRESILERAHKWIVSGDTGISSVTIWACMMGIEQIYLGRCDTPSDPSDFGRCYRLFKLIPEWEERIEELRKYKIGVHISVGLPDERHNHDKWGSFVDHYPQMKKWYEEEYESGKCEGLYNLMKALNL